MVIVIASWLFTQRISEYGRAQQLRDLATVAATAAASLDPQAVVLLKGSAADNGNTAFAIVRAQLRRIHDAIPTARFVYLVTLREDHIVFLADAESPNSPDYSPPGQVYAEAPDAFRQAFVNPFPLAYGAYHDRWGDWITGISVVRAPGGGPVRAVLGVDVSAKYYLARLADYRNFALAIVGLFVLNVALFVTVFFIMRRYNRRLQNDLTELNLAQTRLQLDAAVIRNSAEGVMVTNAQLQIEIVNPAFERITGYTGAEVVGQTPKILFSGKHDESFFQQLHEKADAEGSWRGEIWNRRRDGELYAQQTSISVLRDAKGQINHYAMVFSDNTVQNKIEAKLREMSSIDGLTGISNRRTFDEVLAREWARALRDGSPLSLLMADIDYFKGYNDRYGHLEGDRCLQLVARAIHETANRGGDLAARYGGEEFSVILATADAAEAAVMGEHIRANVAALALPHGGSDVAAFVTISVGVATAVPQQASQQVDLIGAADRALYQAKHTGRNRVVTATDASSNSEKAPES